MATTVTCDRCSSVIENPTVAPIFDLLNSPNKEYIGHSLLKKDYCLHCFKAVMSVINGTLPISRKQNES